MFDFVWNLNENEFENFKEKQRTYKESNYDGGWIGNVWCGLLCFDIIDFDTFLHFDLYVGGVDTGYGYSDRLKDQPDYPYDFCSTHSLHIEDSFTDGYTIDVVGQYDSVEEASRNLYLEYEKMCSQEIYPEWQQQSHCDYEDAILYLNGEDVHVWQVVTA